MARILMVASEAVPFAKTGGLADVAGALPTELKSAGDDVAVVLPRYGHISLQGLRRVWDRLDVWSGPHHFPVDIYAAELRGVTYYLVDHPVLYDRPGLYMVSGADYPDNHIRFAVLCYAALGVARHLFRPDIFHLHDWQAALVAPYLRTTFRFDPSFFGTRIVTTIHNLGYQGRFGSYQLGDIGLDGSLMRPDLMEFHGDVNLLKGGIVYADAITTVSRGYAREIQTPEFGFGLDGLLRARSSVLHGILNGVDYAEWDPRHDSLIAANYSPENLAGKRACKADLLRELQLPLDGLDRPIIGIVSRFVDQKGFDLIAGAAHSLMGVDNYLAVLGSGESKYEDLFRWMAQARPDRVALHAGYNNRLAHKIEAGADIFLMPSRYEPCGLNQIYSLRYGTVPVVRATGGLDDTIDAETGFKFTEYDAGAMLRAIESALALYVSDPARWTQMMLAGMARDFSWRRSALEYSALFRSLSAKSMQKSG
jgi:starch synthase